MPETPTPGESRDRRPAFRELIYEGISASDRGSVGGSARIAANHAVNELFQLLDMARALASDVKELSEHFPAEWDGGDAGYLAAGACGLADDILASLNPGIAHRICVNDASEICGNPGYCAEHGCQL